MVEITAANALILYLGITLAILFGLWIFQHYASSKRTILSTPEELFLCEYCHFVYLEKAALKLTRCPGCRSLNEGNRYKPLASSVAKNKRNNK